jgi:hypothetical protein
MHRHQRLDPLVEIDRTPAIFVDRVIFPNTLCAAVAPIASSQPALARRYASLQSRFHCLHRFPFVIARSEATKQSSSLVAPGLLRFARNDVKIQISVASRPDETAFASRASSNDSGDVARIGAAGSAGGIVLGGIRRDFPIALYAHPQSL